MSDDIQTYASMSEFYASIGGKLEQDVDFTIHRLEEIHSQAPFKSKLFRTNYYSIVLICQGKGRYFIDGKSYATKDRTLYFTNPGHIKGFEVEQIYQGYIITFSESFLKQYIHMNIFDSFPFLIAETVLPQYLSDIEFHELEELNQQIFKYFESDSDSKFEVISHLTVVLLLRIKEWFWNRYDPREELDTGSSITQTFKRSLEDHFRAKLAGHCDRHYQVKDYAEAQFLNPAYFTTVIKRKTGKSVSTWIAEKTIAEAQALLIHSPESVQEIAFRLGFKDAAHFSRFFKKHTQLSPSHFRRGKVIGQEG